LRQAFADIYKNNRLSVVSNGDYGSNYPNSYVYPAAFPTGLLAVGSSDNNDQPSFFSYSGNMAFTSVIAPGDGIYSTNYNNTYTNGAGTSFAAPFVAGIASLLKGYNTALYNDDIIHIIEMSTNSVGNVAPTAYTNSAGYGRVNAQEALQYLQAPYTIEHLTTTGGTVYATSPTQEMVMLGVNRLSDAGYIVQRIQVRKTITLPTNFCSISGVWGTGMGSTGLRDDGGYCYGEPFCEVVPGTLTATQATLETYVYYVTDILGDNLGYYPELPQNATFAYTVIGIPEPTIAGDNAFCNTSDAYTVTNLTTAPGVTASIVWSASPSLVTVNTPNASQTTLTSNSGGTFTLNAAITNGCGLNHNITISKSNIAVNNPPAPAISITGIEPLQAGTQVNVTVSTIENSPYLWYVNGTLVATEYTKSATINGGSNCNVLNTLKVSVANSCGTTSATTQFTRPCTGSNFVLSPNPSTGMVTVSSAPLSKSQSDIALASSSQAGSFYAIKVVDQLGNVRKLFTYPTGNTSAQLDLSSLPSGTYFVQISDKMTWSTQQVIILK